MANYSYKWPGVYPNILDNSQIIVDNTITSLGLVGEAETGVIDTPVLYTTPSEWIGKFGSVSSKYRYAPFFATTISESIPNSYYVRVVNKGDPDNHSANDAKWACNKVYVKEYTGEEEPMEGFYYEEIKAYEDARDNGLDSGLFSPDDLETAFVASAISPDNRQVFITLTDSTINTNKGYNVTACDLYPANESGATETSTLVKLTVSKDLLEDLAPNNYITVKRMYPNALNGDFEIVDYTLDDENNKMTVSYIVPEEVKTESHTNGNVTAYPSDNQTTFAMTVYIKNGKVYQAVEQYNECTLYQAKDGYGNSTFLEDVINGSSNYIQVFVNENFAKDDIIALPKTTGNYISLIGGNAGKFGSEEERFKAVAEGFEQYRDRSQITISLLSDAGYVSKSDISVQSKILEIAEYRRDCFAVFTTPMTENTVEDIIDWRNNIQAFNTYRAALYAPWVKSYDSINGRANFLMPSSAYALKIMAQSQPWVAPAGLNRGLLASSICTPMALNLYVNETTGGQLYTDNQINMAIKSPTGGYVMWGQRTLQKSSSAMDRINVSRTVIYIETVLRDALKWHLFENNTSYERQKVTMEISSFMDSILAAGGIEQYTVQCDEANNPPAVIAQNKLCVLVRIRPQYCIEFIQLVLSLENGVASVEIVY